MSNNIQLGGELLARHDEDADGLGALEVQTATGTWREFFTEVALGNVPGHYAVNKFGAAPSGLQVTETDIWGRADATPTQQIWLPPKAARIHAIKSSSTSDTWGGGTAASSVVIYGLKTWDTAETSETVQLAGTANVNTANSYVIIHRMIAKAQATTTFNRVNVGTITATAATDATVTAVILPGNGQTEMAIYGVPSTQKALLYAWYVGIDKAQGVAASADFRLMVNENPNTQIYAYVRKGDISLQSTGSSTHQKTHAVPSKFTGPCIIKIVGSATTADTDGEAGFDLILVDN